MEHTENKRRHFPRQRFAIRIGVASAILMAGTTSAALAADWKGERGLTVSERYTDNVNLAPANRQREGDLITEIRPSIQINKNGARLQARISYALQSLAYLNNSEYNSLNHQLNAAANAELLNDLLFLDARTTVSQQNISALAPVGFNNTNATQNLTTVGTYSVSPYVKKRFGSFANGDLRIARSGIYYDSRSASDAVVDSMTGALTSGTSFSDVFWGINYRYTKNNNRFGADSELERASATVGYVLTRKFRVSGTAGSERNNFISMGDNKVDGPFWNVGFQWVPSVRTSVAATFGERFFGRTYSFDLSQRTRHTNWRASYAEDVSTSNITSLSYALQSELFACDIPPAKTYPTRASPIGNLYVIPPGEDPGNCTQVGARFSPDLSLTREIFIAKNLTAGVGLNAGKSNYNLAIYSRRRDLQQSGTFDRQVGMNAGWNWRFAPYTTFNLNGNLMRFEVPAQNREDDLWSVAGSLTHRFRPKMSGSILARHQARTSNLPGNNFTENSILARVTMRF